MGCVSIGKLGFGGSVMPTQRPRHKTHGAQLQNEKAWVGECGAPKKEKREKRWENLQVEHEVLVYVWT